MTAIETADATFDDAQRLRAAARELVPMIRAHRDDTERSGRTPPTVVRALADAGLFRMWLPRSLGGFELDPWTFLEVVEDVAAADGAAAWNMMIGASYGWTAGYLPESAGREIWDNPYSVVAGQISPGGRAVTVDGGYRVSGRWSFGSGILHSTSVISGCVVYDGAGPSLTGAGAPKQIHVMTPVGEVRIDEDSWHVSGLRGTGSCDYAMDDVFVPQGRSFLLFGDRRHHPGPLYRLPTPIFAYPIVAVMLGVTRAAIEALIDVATTKMFMGRPLAEISATQLAVARAHALLQAARSYLRQAVEEMWRTAVEGANVTNLERARAYAAAVFAPQLCIEALDQVWKTAGAVAIRESTVIERCFRDIHAASQHLGLSEIRALDAGRVLMGLEPRNPAF